jgi:hypothetical protein
MELLRYILLTGYILFNVSVFNGQDYKIRLIEAHGEYFGNVDQFGVGANVNYGSKWFAGVLEYNFRKANLNSLNPEVKVHEFLGGIRFYPMRPTMMAGKMAFRPTFGGLYGFDMEPNWRGLLFAGIAISPVTGTSGLTVNFVYRPGAFPAQGYLIEPSWMIRIGILFGPSMN